MVMRDEICQDDLFDQKEEKGLLLEQMSLTGQSLTIRGRFQD